MGAFFLVSGLLSAASLKRAIGRANRLDKGSRTDTCWSFFKGKLLRLGLPAAVYTLFGHALTLAAGKSEPFTWSFYKSYVANWIATPGVRGPAWYCALALIFDGLFAAHTALDLPTPHIGRYAPPAIFAALPVCSFLWRRICPLGWNFTPLGLDAAYLPQYILAYATGIFLSYNPQLLVPPSPHSQTHAQTSKWRTSPLPALGLYLAGAAFLATLPATRSAVRDPTRIFGWNPVAFMFCIWNELGFAALTHSALWLAHFCTDPSPQRKRILPRLAYGAFLVHSPITTFIPVQLRELQLPPVAKVVVVGSICTALSFAVSALLVGVPGIQQVI